MLLERQLYRRVERALGRIIRNIQNPHRLSGTAAAYRAVKRDERSFIQLLAYRELVNQFPWMALVDGLRGIETHLINFALRNRAVAEGAQDTHGALASREEEADACQVEKCRNDGEPCTRLDHGKEHEGGDRAAKEAAQDRDVPAPLHAKCEPLGQFARR